MNSTYSGWHVLYVKTQHEKKVDLLLKESALESFLPTITAIRQWSDRRKKIIQPLFPSYVFLHVNSKNDFYTALNVQGVFKYLRFGNEYAKVRNEEIRRIKQFLNLEGISDVETAGFTPKKGDKMIINYGPLSGLECLVIKTNNRNRIFVRIESLRQNITATIPVSYLSEVIKR